MNKNNWYKINPTKEKDLFVAADKKYGNYNYENDLRTYFLRQFNKLLSSLIQETNKKILIGGANSGTEIKALKKKHNQIFALDASKTALEKISQKNPSVKTIRGDLNSIPFKNNFFDYYICMRAINSSTVNLKKALMETLRVTKKRGTIILSIPNGYVINKKIQKGLYDYKKKEFDLKKPYKITKKIILFYEKKDFLVKTIELPSEIIILIKKE